MTFAAAPKSAVRKDVSRKVALISILATTLLACRGDSDPATAVTPGGRTASMSSAADEFYYYNGQRIDLVVDPSRLIIGSEDSASVAQDTRVAGANLRSVRRLAGRRNEWLLAIEGSDRTAVTAVVARIRAERRHSFVSPVYRTLDGQHDILPVNRVLVRFRATTQATQIDSVQRVLGLSLIRPPRPDSGFNYHVFAYPVDSASPLRIAALLDRHPLVEWADPDKVSNRQRATVPTDTYYAQQFHLKNSITRNGIRVDDNVEMAWDLTTGQISPAAGGVRVGIVGDGVEASHADLGGRVLNGYDALSCYPGCVDSEINPFAGDNHETAVAGIIVGQHNGTGIAGIAPGTYVIPGRIFRGTAVASDQGIADAINFLWAYKTAWVISNSWGGGAPSNAIANAIRDANTQGRSGSGTVVVFSAGNTSQRSFGVVGAPHWPGTMPEVVSVSAINRNGEVTDYAPEGSTIDIVAPSGHFTNPCVGEVVTTDPTGASGCNDGPTGDINYTSTFSGTSAAAPQVAAVAALIMARTAGVSASAVKSRLYQGADHWGSATQFGAGKLNAFKSVQNVAVTISGPVTIRNAGNYTWNVAASGGTGSYSFTWEESVDGGPFVAVGTGTSRSRYVDNSILTIDYRVTATSGIESGTDNHFVGVLIPQR